MINSIGSSSSYYNSLFGASGTSGTSSTGSTSGSSSLAQTEEQLFAAMDTDGNGSVSESKFSNFRSEERRVGKECLE